MSAASRIVVVGASVAGMSTAEALRQGGYKGELTVLGQEAHLPYDRPPLSKDVLKGAGEPVRPLRPPHTYCAQGIDLRLATAAGSVDLDRHVVQLVEGGQVGFEFLVIATGVRPRRLSDGHDTRGVHVLRSLDDAVALRHALSAASRVLIVGGGFLGTEVAAVSSDLGLDVSVVCSASALLARQVGDDIGALVTKMHLDHDVRIYSNNGVKRLASSSGHVTAVELDDGTRIPVDVVVVAIGSEPETDWLEGSGIAVDDGVLCDDVCRVADGVFAAGDVANWYHRGLGARLRVEHRLNAGDQGRAVASSILGARKPFVPIPYFWSDQYANRLQGFGIFPHDAEVDICEGAVSNGRFVASYRVGAELVGVLGWNAPKDIMKYLTALSSFWGSY